MKPFHGALAFTRGAGLGSLGEEPRRLCPSRLFARRDLCEDKNLTIEQTSGRSGVWYLFGDGTVGTLDPSPLVMTDLTESPEVLGSYGLHVTVAGGPRPALAPALTSSPARRWELSEVEPWLGLTSRQGRTGAAR